MIGEWHQSTEIKSGNKKSVDYKYTDTNGVDYTFVTEQVGKLEKVVTYYSNNKGGNSHSSNTQLRAQIGNSTSIAGRGNINNSNSQIQTLNHSNGTIFGWIENGEICCYSRFRGLII